MCFCFFFTSFVFGQSIEKLNLKTDSIKLSIKSIDEQMEKLNLKKLSLQLKLTELNQQKNKILLEKELVSGIPVIVNFMGGVLRDTPKGEGNEIIKIPSGDTLFVYNWYEKPYFKAAYMEKVGYISYSSLVKNKQIDNIVNKDLAVNNPRLVRLISEYGKFDAERIINKKYWIGMTTEMAIASLGSPDDINKSTGSWGEHQQWVYNEKKMYLYFENGKLTSFQN